MAHPAFGDGITIDLALRDLLRAAPQLCATDTTLLMRDYYETTYGICNHPVESASRPLALIAMQWSEDNTTESALHGRIRQYGDSEVRKYFKLSLKEFLDYPRDVGDLLLEEAKRLLIEEGKKTKDVLDGLENPK